MGKIIETYKSFKEADKADIEYWRNAFYKTRIETLLYVQEFFLRFSYLNVKRTERIINTRKLGE